MNRFTNKTIIVTGSSSGIGEGIARRFAAENANVVLNSPDRAECEKVAADLGGALDEGRVLIVEGDVAKPEFAGEIIAQTIERFGALDVLVNNAGVVRLGMLADASDADIDIVIDTNLKAVLYLCRAAIPHLAKSNGSIVNISSVSGSGGDWALPIYNASKGGVCNLTRGLALQLGEQGVRVNAVLPSVTRSRMTEMITENDRLMKDVLDRMPLGRVGEPDDIAGPVLFLASDDARFVTGVNLPVDGGVSASNGQPNFLL